MGFLDNLLNRNPTKEWQPQKDLELILDVDQESFCGIKIGDDVRTLQKLGPAEDAAAARNGWYRYPSSAFDITTEQGRVVEVQLTFNETECFGGHVRINGKELPLEGDITEVMILAAAGKADERIVDDDELGQEVILRFNRSRATWDFELNTDGKLVTIWGGKKD